MSPLREMMIELTKAQLWEEAKGKLRAMVAVHGAWNTNAYGTRTGTSLATLNIEVEAFIKNIEDNGMQE